MSRGHDARLAEREYLEIDTVRPLRHAMEIRHRSFVDPRFIAMLRKHNVALVVAETAQRWPLPCDVTADFVYIRLHGDKTIYQSGYGPKALAQWAERIRAWASGKEPANLPRSGVVVTKPLPAPAGRDVYCYFDNTDAKLRAPADARNLMRALGIEATLH